MKTFQKTFIGIFWVTCLLASSGIFAQRYFDPYNCNDYKSFSLRIVNFSESGEKHFIANDSRMEISFVHNGEKTIIPNKGESKVWGGKSTAVFDNCSIYLDGFPMENYNQYIQFYNEMAGRVSQLQGSEDFISKMYGMPDSRNPGNLANGIKIAQKLMQQFEDINRELKNKLNTGNVSRNFDYNNHLDKLIYTCASNINTCKKVIGENQTSIDNAKKEGDKNEQKPRSSSQSSQTNNADSDFWTNSQSSANNSTSASNSNRTAHNNESFKTASQFKGGLDDIKDGEYFEDDKGNHFQKEKDGARKVEKAVYERHSANKVYKQMELREAGRQQRDAEFSQNWDNLSTSFYTMSNAQQGLRDASNLNGHFKTIEELNEAFAQKMIEISNMGSALKQSSTQAIQAYSSTLSSAPTGYDYSGYTNTIGAIGSAIASNKAEKKAREELRVQRAEQEAKIKERELKALITIRSEIDKIFIDGGMPLSSHKVEAPVLYLFAHGSNKSEWNRNQSVTMSVSNVIQVHRYNDGTYPYTSNVKRTFESSGISEPVLIGYFTNKDEAEKYRNSLLEIAPNAKFSIKEVEVKLEEQNVNTNAKQSDVDFWGTKTTDNKSQTKNNNKQAETDFWGVSVKEKNAEPKNPQPME